MSSGWAYTLSGGRRRVPDDHEVRYTSSSVSKIRKRLRALEARITKIEMIIDGEKESDQKTD